MPMGCHNIGRLDREVRASSVLDRQLPLQAFRFTPVRPAALEVNGGWERTSYQHAD